MDFDFTDDQESLRDAVRKWVDKGYDFGRRRAITNEGGFSREAYGELMMQAAGPYSLPFIEEAMEAGWQGDFPGGEVANAPLAGTYFNLRKTTIYGGSNEVQRNIVSQVVLG